MGRPERVSRARVLKAARESFAERGFDGTTLAAIGARVGLSPAALLRHAPTKEALFAAAMADAPLDETSPLGFLREIEGDEDPRTVLRRIAHVIVPFFEEKIGESIARWMRSKSADGLPSLRLPFPVQRNLNPAVRNFGYLVDYFRRARRAGVIVGVDPRAAALALLAALHAYVFLHRVVRIADPPVPLDLYVDTLIAVWTRGALRERRRRRGA